VVPQSSTLFAGENTSAPAIQEKTVLADVALNGEGKLVGQVVDHQGIPRANSVVKVATMHGEVVSQTRTDAQGNFAANVGKGGIFLVSGEMNSSAVRVWTQNAAPPAANEAVMFVDDNQAVRGNFFRNANGGPRVVLIGTALAITGGAIYSGISQNSGS
jgi:hypothetical protein